MCFIIGKQRYKGKNTINKLLFMYSVLPEFLIKRKPLLLPIVAKSLFIKDYNLIEGKDWIEHYYKEQCAMKEMYGIKANIKFIN